MVRSPTLCSTSRKLPATQIHNCLSLSHVFGSDALGSLDRGPSCTTLDPASSPSLDLLPHSVHYGHQLPIPLSPQTMYAAPKTAVASQGSASSAPPAPLQRTYSLHSCPRIEYESDYGNLP
ncbi:uncharacterized protein N7503_007572 [Penicillium pulvis]|uniref:uncharacterized protein n=1 Tax=Penicillium pulvis TaxID=1562058 RepID=UPI0025499D2D|nr:uncharacterized protein N7503_007572 [Penicillium pulvis]KAJ5798276.1 hypothetical protein N7503_007572 [Penicillium pulvis]